MMKRKILWIIVLALLFTPATTITMPDAVSQHPGGFASFKDMMRYYTGITRHGLTGKMIPVEVVGDEMYFYRNGKKCRL